MQHDLSSVNKLIGNNEIYITSGEGELGNIKTYTGKRTMRAIKMRLTKERCGGDRWARAEVFSHSNSSGDVFLDLETGEYRSIATKIGRKGS